MTKSEAQFQGLKSHCRLLASIKKHPITHKTNARDQSSDTENVAEYNREELTLDGLR